MYDIVIIGCGPAGAHCASQLAKNSNLNVCLIDKRSMLLTSNHRKSCGGLISSHAQQAFSAMNIQIPTHIKVDPQFHTVKTYDFDAKLSRNYRREYINVDRSKFEGWMIDAIPQKVEKRFETQVIAIEINADQIRLNLRTNKKESYIETKYVIAADGAQSFVRSTCFPDIPSMKMYVSIQEIFNTSSDHPAYYGIFDSSITDYYSWIIQKKNEIIVGSALEINDQVNAKFEILKQKIDQECDIELKNPIRREGAFIARPTRFAHLFFGSDRIAIIGEASGAISPTSAEGYSYTLKTARQCARSIEKYGPTAKATRHFNRHMLKVRISILGKWIKSPGMYVLWVRKWVMISGITSISSK